MGNTWGNIPKEYMPWIIWWKGNKFALLRNERVDNGVYAKHLSKTIVFEENGFHTGKLRYHSLPIDLKGDTCLNYSYIYSVSPYGIRDIIWEILRNIYFLDRRLNPHSFSVDALFWFQSDLSHLMSEDLKDPALNKW